ncbi:MAG: aminotransferase class V-fold PLP-dependent enzyme [Geminicoccaceae bacterium]
MSTDTHAPDTLGLEPEDMRRLGYRMVDLVVDHFRHKAERPAIVTGTPQALQAALGGPLPEAPGDPDAAMDLLVAQALSHMQHADHPRYFARVPGPSSFAAVLGEWLATGHNAICASWVGGSGPATLELIVIDWLRQLMGMPAGTEGVLVSGGSLASFTAFAAARATIGPGLSYLTDQTHSSLARDLRAMGCDEDEIRILASDDALRMPLGALRAAIAADRAGGRRPMMVVATAGTTNTGAVDPLPELVELCRAEGIWLHVDGAYGGPAALCDAGRAALRGMGEADSLVLDPHKWLFQPYDVGCVLVRRPGALERAFSMNPEYLKDVMGAAGEVHFGNRSLELTRRSRAVKLWLSFRTYGAGRMRAAVARGIELAETAETILRRSPGLWEIVTPAQLGIVTFALRGADAALHADRAKALSESGYAAVTSTTLKSRSVLRLCTINPLTTEGDLEETIRRLADPTP